MPVSKETQTWLDELKKEGEVDDATFKTLSDALGKNEKLDTFIKTKHGEGLRQEDYNKHMNDLQVRKEAQEKEFKGKMDTVNSYEAQLGTWKTEQEEKIKDGSTSRAEVEAKLAALETKVQTVAVEHGLDPKDFAVEAAPNPPSPKPTDGALAYDPEVLKKDFIPRKEFDQVATGHMFLPAVLHDINVEHEKLTGESLSMESLVREAADSKKSVREYWEEKYDISAKRTAAEETSQKEHDEKIKTDAIKETETRLASEQFTPKPRPDDHKGSPVLEAKFELPPVDEGNKAVPEAKQREARVRAAVQAHTEAESQSAGQTQ